MLNIVNLFHQGKPLACDKLIIYFVAVVVEFKKKKNFKTTFHRNNSYWTNYLHWYTNLPFLKKIC